ncbi:MAG: ATP-binding protein [Bacteroidia bacterium]|nr:ATP-binding protein [Bacteroidia bacterium]
MKSLADNPFIVSGYLDERYFCDREKETQTIIKNINGNMHTAMFAIRRIGKTGLIKHAFHLLQKQKNITCIYVDILATHNLRDFTNALATAVYNKIPENKNLSKYLSDFVRRLRAVISYDPITGSPQVTLDIANKSAYEKTILQIFEFLQQHKNKIVIAIDEFQQILHYPEKNVEALLRSHIQGLKNTAFIFSGSNQKLMHHIFNNAKRPFYASCSNLHLDFIAPRKYAQFITTQLARYQRKITPEALDFILEWTFCHTYYIQFLCNRLFEKKIKTIQLRDVLHTCDSIHALEESIYYQYRNMLTATQWQLLKAIAMEEKVYKPNAAEFIKKYQLGAVSSINRSLEALLNKELIYKATFVPEPYYTLNDKFFLRWLQRK